MTSDCETEAPLAVGVLCGCVAMPPRLSEDFSFCRRAKRDYRFQIWVDTSVQCDHVGLGESQGGVFRPSQV